MSADTIDWSGCYNTDVPLWASYFRNHPETNLTYVTEPHVCAVILDGECVAKFPTEKLAMDCMTKAREQAAIMRKDPS